MIYPFSTYLQKAYPKETVEEFYKILGCYKDDMQVVDLWNEELSDDNFSEITHLNMKGAVKISEKIHEKVTKMI